MGRRNRRSTDDVRPLSGAYGQRRTESGPDGPWVVQNISAQAAAKSYTCPGCRQEVRPGVAHVVAWSTRLGSDTRRHWHSPCWAARDRRR